MSYKKDWKLTQEALDEFLSSLSHDRDEAAAEYLKLWKRLYYYFEKRRAADPTRLIDITIDRAARTIMTGEKIRNLLAFVFGIAHNVAREYWDSPEMRSGGLDGDVLDDRTRDDEERLDLERRLDCLERCAEKLPETERQNVIDYYSLEKRANIDRRKRMAEVLGISQITLRVRMHRIREKLEQCITKCMGIHEKEAKHFGHIST